MAKWASFKASYPDQHPNLAASSEFDLHLNLNTTSAGAAFSRWRDRSHDPAHLWVRVSYAFTQDTYSLVSVQLPKLAPLLDKDAILMLGSGKWDLWWFNQHLDYWCV